MNILDYLFAIQRMRDDRESRPVPSGIALPYQDITQGQTPATPRFRDPEQAGPAPPTGGPLSRMFGSAGSLARGMEGFNSGMPIRMSPGGAMPRMRGGAYDSAMPIHGSDLSPDDLAILLAAGGKLR